MKQVDYLTKFIKEVFRDLETKKKQEFQIQLIPEKKFVKEIQGGRCDRILRVNIEVSKLTEEIIKEKDLTEINLNLE